MIATQLQGSIFRTFVRVLAAWHGAPPGVFVYLSSPSGPKWRNWQTRYVQGVVGVLPSGFESPLRHPRHDCPTAVVVPPLREAYETAVWNYQRTAAQQR